MADFIPDNIWTDKNEQFKTAPRLTVQLDSKLSRYSSIIAENLWADMTGKFDCLMLVGISGPQLNVVMALPKSGDKASEFAALLLDDGLLEGVFYSYGVVGLQLEQFPQPERNGKYERQSPWRIAPAA